MIIRNVLTAKSPELLFSKYLSTPIIARIKNGQVQPCWQRKRDSRSLFQTCILANFAIVKTTIDPNIECGSDLGKHWSKERRSLTAMPFFALFYLCCGHFRLPVWSQMHRWSYRRWWFPAFWISCQHGKLRSCQWKHGEQPRQAPANPCTSLRPR